MAEVEFAAFVAARSGALLRTAYALTGDRQLAEDLLQTALLKAYGHWHRIRDPEPYLRTAMVRTYASWWQRRWRGEVPVAELPETPAPDAEQHTRAALLAALATLPRRQRAVLVLRYFEDLADPQIADLLGVSTGTVKSQASRALHKLRTTGQIRDIVWEEQP